MKVKMILPALTEATSPFLRPIKYSLFPPLGLATLAGYLADDDEVEIQDEHVERLDLDDAPGPGRDPGLHHVGAPRLRDRRPLPRARGVRRARRAARHVAARRGRRARRHDLPRPGRGHLAAVPRRLPRAAARGARLPLDASRTLDGAAAHPPRPDQAAPLPRAQLDRRLARLPARVRLLLQGGLLRGRHVVLHADASTPRWPRSSACRAATSTSSTTTCSATAASPRALFDGMRGMGRLWQAAGTVQRDARAAACSRRRSRPGCAACSSASRR